MFPGSFNMALGVGGDPFFGETEIAILNPYLWLDASDSIFTDKSSNNLTITNYNSGYVDNAGTQNGLSTAGNTNSLNKGTAKR